MQGKEWVNRVRESFRENSNPDNAGTMEAYMKGIAPFLGIKAEKRRDLSKELLKSYNTGSWNDVRVVTEDLFKEKEREFHYLAQEFLMKNKKIWPEESIQTIEKLIVTKSWWDTVDFLAAHCAGEYFNKYQEKRKEVLPLWISSTNMWLNRAAMLFQLKYKSKTDTQWLQKAILPHVDSKEFFHQKAIGWILREYSKTDPDWVFNFLKNNKLKPLSVREASKYLK